MNIALLAYSRNGCETARRVMEALPEDEIRCYTAARIAQPPFGEIPKPSREFYGALFAEAQAMIFVGSVGIAVREIAPHVRSKATDPAVIAVDERGQFVVSVLSGHIGGANALTGRLAAALGATPVITTATDINHRFSVDAWAARRGYLISSLSAAKAVSAAVLEGEVPLCADAPIVPPLPAGVCLGQSGAVGIHIGYRKCRPFETTLHLIPPVLQLGLGCRRGTEQDAARRAVEQVCRENAIDRRAICCAASIDLKADEAGLLEYCREEKLPISFHSAAALQAVPGEFTPSDFVRSVTGVDNVCERAALLGAERLIVRKTALDGVTVALAVQTWEVRFE